jgi:hypothetical protein
MNNRLIADAVRKYVRQQVVSLAGEFTFEDDQEFWNKVTMYLEKNSGDTFL